LGATVWNTTGSNVNGFGISKDSLAILKPENFGANQTIAGFVTQVGTREFGHYFRMGANVSDFSLSGKTWNGAAVDAYLYDKDGGYFLPGYLGANQTEATALYILTIDETTGKVGKRLISSLGGGK